MRASGVYKLVAVGGRLHPGACAILKTTIDHSLGPARWLRGGGGRRTAATACSRAVGVDAPASPERTCAADAVGGVAYALPDLRVSEPLRGEEACQSSNVWGRHRG